MKGKFVSKKAGSKSVGKGKLVKRKPTFPPKTRGSRYALTNYLKKNT